MTPAEIAAIFRKMADRVEKNADEPFAGCFVIVPPGEDAEQAVSLLKLDDKPDAALFWGEVQSKATDAVAKMTLGVPGYGRR